MAKLQQLDQQAHSQRRAEYSDPASTRPGGQVQVLCFCAPAQAIAG